MHTWRENKYRLIGDLAHSSFLGERLFRTSKCYNQSMVQKDTHYTFDPVDIVQMRLRASLSPARRIQVMLDARELAVGLKRGRIRKRFPDLSDREINLKLVEELSHVRKQFPRPVVNDLKVYQFCRSKSVPV